MAFTIDNLLAAIRATALHPIASLVLPGILILTKAEPLPLKIAADFSSVEWIGSISGRFQAALGCVAFSWLLEWNRSKNRRALNPSPKLKYNWQKEIIVVTGGSGGIGGELVRMLEKLGTTVAIMDLIPPTFTAGPKTHYFRTNVASFEDITRVYKEIITKLSIPTILVANAGVVRGRTILDASERDFQTTFEVNVLGVLYCIKTFLPSMIAADHGHVFITASATAFTTVANGVDYSASKAAINSIIEGLQTEMKHKYGNPNVKVSAIYPATIAAKMFEGIDSSLGGFALPLLQPEEVAERMFQILLNGESEMAMMPAASNAQPWLRVIPYWMRVIVQDSGAEAMAHLSAAKRD